MHLDVEKYERMKAASYLTETYRCWFSAHETDNYLIMWFEASCMPDVSIYVPFNFRYLNINTYFIRVVRNNPNIGIFSPIIYE